VAAIQHSAWTALADNILASYGLQDCKGLFRVADALHQKSKSKEAVWRVLAADTVLEDKRLQDSLRDRLGAITRGLVESWDLFQDEKQGEEFRRRLTELFYQHTTTWLSLLKLQKRVSWSLRWDERLFQIDTGEDSVKVPGGFVQHQAVTPILFMSPAFLEDSTDGKTSLPTVLRQGTVMMSTSPLLQAALKEEQEASSPRLTNRSLVSPTRVDQANSAAG
jgi:hypothetical protein